MNQRIAVSPAEATKMSKRGPRAGTAAPDLLNSNIPDYLDVEEVLSVHHWTNDLFSFRCTRGSTFRFTPGQFVMMGLMVEGHPLLRAYSMASAAWDAELEFFSIKVADGPLTSRLQHIRVGSKVLVKRKPVGSLVISNLQPGGNLWLLATGTGLAPFLSILHDPETYERFDKVIVCHTVRQVKDLAYREQLQSLPAHEWLSQAVADKLHYYPSVTREDFNVRGRITDLIHSGQVFRDLELQTLHPHRDRVMLCGSDAMNRECCDLLEARGFVAGNAGERGTYLYERAFVTR